MGKIIRLTENDLNRLVRRTLKEWRGNYVGPGQPERNDFYKKLEEALEFAGEESEYLFMALSNKIDEWIDNAKYERQSR